MRATLHCLALALIVLFFCQPVFGEAAASSDLESKLRVLASYESGQPKKILHATRMAAFRDTDDDGIRKKHEELLLEFVASGATVDARREACLWLAALGSGASEPVLQRLLEREELADVAQSSLDAVRGKAIRAPEFSTAQGALEAEVLSADNPLALLVAAWQGDNDERARYALELMRKGVGGEEAAQWLSDHMIELSADRQILAMQVLLGSGSPQGVVVVDALSRQAEGEARRAAVRHLGFLRREKDGPYLMDLYCAADQDLAESARQALLTLPLSLVQEPLIRELRSSEPSRQARAIELAAQIRDFSTTETLLAMARDQKNPNRVAAARSLGKVAPADSLEEMIGHFAGTVGSPLEAPFKLALWDLVRKQPDADAARMLLQSHQAGADDEVVRKILQSLEARLDRLLSESSKP